MREQEFLNLKTLREVKHSDLNDCQYPALLKSLFNKTYQMSYSIIQTYNLKECNLPNDGNRDQKAVVLPLASRVEI